MPKITVTYDFTSEQEALAFLSGKAPAEHKVATHHVQAAEVAESKAAEPAPTPAAEAQPGATALTLDDVRKAFTEYVGRGGGRTAATAMAILQAHGVASIKAAKPEQYAVLVNAFQTA